VPPFRHGLGQQPITLSKQVGPVKNGVHSQEKVLPLSVQVPPFWQGLGLQLSSGSTGISQVSPVYKSSHSQVNESTPSVQLPPLRQGLGSQSSAAIYINCV